MHGIWSTEHVFMLSDRNQKYDISPLRATLGKEREKIAGPSDNDESGVAWILRQLRPVSFRFKGQDTKELAQNRYGFVAQEVKRVLPNVVRGEGGPESTQRLLYDDLLTVVALAVKEQRARIQREEVELVAQREEAEALLAEAEALERVLDEFEAANASHAAEEALVEEPRREGALRGSFS